MGRPPAGARALTPAEKQRNYRARKKDSTEAIPPVQRPVLLSGADVQQFFENAKPTSRGKLAQKMPSKRRCNSIAKNICRLSFVLNDPEPYNSFADALKHARLFLDNIHMPLFVIKLHLKSLYVPTRKRQDGSAPYNPKRNLLVQLKNFKRAAKALQTLVNQHTMKDWEGPPWVWLCIHIAIEAIDAWSEVGRPPKAVNHNSPVCIFVAEVLGFLGFERTAAAVSEVLRGRRHRDFFIPLKQIWANR